MVPEAFDSMQRVQGVSGWEGMKSLSVDRFLENFASWTKDRWNKCELMEFLWFKDMFYDHMTSATHRLALKEVPLLVCNCLCIYLIHVSAMSEGHGPSTH